MKRKVSFKSGGLTLASNLFTPKNFDEKGHYKAIIVQGSATSVKEQMSKLYAQKFANEGFVALAFDYSHYGESEGKLRQLKNPATKLSDLEAAVSYDEPTFCTSCRYGRSMYVRWKCRLLSGE